MNIQLLNSQAQVPTRHLGAAAYDLYSSEYRTVHRGGHALVCTGIAIELPEGLAGLVVPRSGLAGRCGVTVLNGPGLIDPDYRGEVKVILVNHGGNVHYVHPGDRIAQLLLTPYSLTNWAVVSELSDTERGEAGHGSSGR